MKGVEIIRYFKDKFGLEVQFADFVNPNTNAKIYNNTIYINLKFSTNPSQILNLAVHEFTHLAIAMLRLKDPDTYVSLITSF